MNPQSGFSSDGAVFTFDCTSSPPPTPIKQVEFRPICVGLQNTSRLAEVEEVAANISNFKWKTLTDLRRELGHQGRQIDILKMDVEHDEYEVFREIFSSGDPSMFPLQIAFESHGFDRNGIESLSHMVVFQQLQFHGYRILTVTQNPLRSLSICIRVQSCHCSTHFLSLPHHTDEGYRCVS